MMLPSLLLMPLQALLRKYLPWLIVVGVVLLVLIFRKLLF
jgi:hypothetical protein